MNNIKGILMVGVVALMVGGCTQKPTETTDTINGTKKETAIVEVTLTPTATSQTGEQPFSGTLKAAVALGLPMKCAYTNPEGQQVEGVIKGKQYLGKSISEGKMVNILMKDECMWTWEDNKTQGQTVCFNPADAAKTATKSVWDQEEQNMPANYNCNPAIVTDTQFTPPANVTFLDLNDLMKGNLSPEQIEQLKNVGK